MAKHTDWRRLRAQRMAEPGAQEAYEAARLASGLGMDASLTPTEICRLLATGERLRAETIEAAARTSAEAPKHAGHGATDPDEAAVLRASMPTGRVVTLPAAQPKRRIVLDHLARAFEPGRRYSEREINTILGSLREPPHRSGSVPPDHVTLRRLLVDEGFLSREGGVYWRSGGTVEV